MKHSRKLKAKKGKWFVKMRGSYIPGSWQGWLTYVPYVVFLGYILLPYALWPLMCTATDPCTPLANQWTVVLVNLVEIGLAVGLMTWIAKKKS